MAELRGMSDIKQVAERLKARMAEIQRKQAEMQGNGTAPVTVKPAPERPACSPDCPRCAGLGWVRADAPYGDPNFGRLLPCPNLPVQMRARVTDARTGLQFHELDSLNWGVIFDNAGSYQAMQQVQKILARGYGLVYLWGDSGTAKTLIMKVAVAEAMRSGNAAAFANAADILDEIREAYNTENPRESAAERLARWSELPLLCIDELGRTSDSGWASEKMFQLLNRRHERAIWQESVTLIGSNTDPQKLDSALYDRMRDSRHLIIHLAGESARTMMRPEDRF